MTILVGCEESQTVTEALLNLGHDVYSCDLYPTSGRHPERHLQMDIFKAINLRSWDMLIFFPPCTYLSRCQQFRVNKCHLRKLLQLQAADFAYKLFNCGIPKVIMENPPGYLVHSFRKYDQLIQPFYYGDNYRKEICLWLKGVNQLPIPPKKNWAKKRVSVSHRTNGRMNQQTKSKIKSKFFPNTARYFAEHFTKPLQQYTLF